MNKRPLCIIVLSAVVCLWLLPASLWMKEPSGGAGQAETVTGEICKIRPRQKGQTIYLNHSNLSDTGLILVYLEAEDSYSVGNTIRIEGQFHIKEPEMPANPGQFDARLYYQTQNVVLICYAEEAVLLDASVRPLAQGLNRLRERLGMQYERLLGEEKGAVLQAMVLGDRTDLLPEVKNLYRQSGLAHLLSISGLHLSILGLGLYRGLRRLGLSFKTAGVFSMAGMLLYGFMTGMSPSTVRALTMFSLAVTADILGRSYDMLTALAASALLLLGRQPLYARNASFLLSFGAVLGIGLVYPVLSRLLPLKKKWGRALLFSLSIQIMTLPVIQYFYYEIPSYSPFLNLIAIPLMTVLMICGVGGLLISFFSMSAAAPAAFVCRGILSLYEWLGGLSLELPGAVYVCGAPKIRQMILYYLGLTLLLFAAGRQIRKMEKQERQEKALQPALSFRLRCMGGYLLLLGMLLFRARDGLMFTMLDVGQGDGLFLRTEAGTTYLIDGGSSSVKEVGTYRLLPFLKHQGVGTLDYIAVSHTDSDHISGITELLELAGSPGMIRIKNLLLPYRKEPDKKYEELKGLAEKAGVRVLCMERGSLILDGRTKLRCIHPSQDFPGGDENASSMVLQIHYGAFTLLLTGDLEEKGEEDILEKKLEVPGSISVLKAGHHGSRFSTKERWLEVLQPKLTLISCGAGNSYGHPHEETLERLRRAGSGFYITALQGAVTIYSDGESFWAETFLDTKAAGQPKE